MGKRNRLPRLIDPLSPLGGVLGTPGFPNRKVTYLIRTRKQMRSERIVSDGEQRRGIARSLLPGDCWAPSRTKKVEIDNLTVGWAGERAGSVCVTRAHNCQVYYYWL